MPRPPAKIYAFPSYDTDILRAVPKQFLREGYPPVDGVGLYLDQELIQFLTQERALRLANQIADAYERSQRG